MKPKSDTVTVEDEDELAQEIEQQVNEWSTNSNECFNIKLVHADGSHAAPDFQPELTYAMFGNEEAIFGYQGLSIDLSFRAYDMKPKLEITYGKIFPEQGDVRPTDIKEALRDFLPRSALKPASLLEDSTEFNPPGRLVHEYRRNGKTYQTYCASLAEPSTRSLLENMQILIPMFIEGGSLLELEQDWTAQRWKIFLVYQVDAPTTTKVSPYTLIGFGTSYRIFTFPERQKAIQFDDFSPSSQTLEYFLPSPQSESNKLSNPPDMPSPLDLPSRERLSQFLIFPPFHRAGHGQELYNVMYRHLTQAENVREFTIEDPNERFDDLRDFCDLLYLRRNVPEFAALRINTNVPQEKLSAPTHIPVDQIVPSGVRKQIMRDAKIMPRQFDRLAEMHTLSYIPPKSRSRNRITRKEKSSNPDDKAYYFWRLYVKQRLYIFNKDQLSQVEHAERVEKLEAALDSVLEAYTEMIERVEAHEKAVESGDFDEGAADPSTSGIPKRKRPVIADDDDDDDDDDEADADDTNASSSANGYKKVKV